MTNHQDTPTRSSSASLLAKLGLLVALTLLTTACAGFDVDVDFGDAVDGSGVAETRAMDVDVSKVTKIEASDVWDVVVVFGDETGVEVTTDDNLFDTIKVEVDGDRLKLLTKGSFNDSLGMDAVVTLADLTELDIRDASSARVTEDLGSLSSIIVRDASEVTLASVTVDDLRVEVRDASAVTVVGTVQSLDLVVRDASEFNGQELTANSVTVEARDSGDVEVSVEGKISGSATDGSSVTVFGAGEMSITTRDGASAERG